MSLMLGFENNSATALGLRNAMLHKARTQTQITYCSCELDISKYKSYTLTISIGASASFHSTFQFV